LGTHNLADLALIQENFEDAALLSTRTLRLWRQLGDAEGIAGSLVNGAFAEINRGRFDEAKDILSESLLVAKELGSVKILAECIGGFAAVAALCGQPLTAARLSGAATKLRETIGVTTEEFEARLEQRTVSLATAKLGEAKFQNAFGQGLESTQEGAIAQALQVRCND
jgi:hypothetical protein